MKRLLICAFAGVILSVYSFGQGMVGDHTYSVIKNDPSATYFGVGGSYDMSISSYNMSIVGLGVDGQFYHERFWVDLHSRIHLAEKLADYAYSQPYARAVSERSFSKDLLIGGGFNVYVKDYKESVGVKVAQRSSTDYVMVIPDMKVQRRYSLEAGYEMGYTYFNMNALDEVEGIDNTGTQITLDASTPAISSYLNFGYVRLGVGTSKVNNVTINTNNFGVKTNNTYNHLYAAALLGISATLDDINTPYDSYNGIELPYTRFDINTAMDFRKAGVVLGFETYSKKKLGIGWSIELGLLPGPKYRLMDSGFLDIKLRFHYGKFI